MNNGNYNKFLKLFDYFKQAYRVNREHKELYKPQVYLILLRALLILAVIFSFLGIFEDMFMLPDLTLRKFASVFMNQFVGTPLLMLLISIIVLLFGTTFVEAGLYNMYYKRITADETNDHFMYGATKYFFPFLGGNIIIGLCWMIAIVPYVIAGFLTLFIGFSLIPLIINIFLMVWKVSIVSDNKGIFVALGNSFAFGKKHFLPAGVYLIIVGSLSSVGGGGSSGSFNSSGWQQSNNYNGGGSISPLPDDSSNWFIRWLEESDPFQVFKTLAIIISVIITITVVVSSLIQMIFDIYFGLVTTITYLNDWQIECAEEVTE